MNYSAWQAWRQGDHAAEDPGDQQTKSELLRISFGKAGLRQWGPQLSRSGHQRRQGVFCEESSCWSLGFERRYVPSLCSREGGC